MSDLLNLYLKQLILFVDEVTSGRVRVRSVQINEHGSNFATCYRNSNTPLNITVTSSEEEPTTETFNNEPTSQPDIKGNTAAPVGRTTSSTKGNWFGGTTWG